MAFDIEHFPTRRAAKEMMAMISPIYDHSYVMKWIMEVIGKPFSKAEDLVDGLAAEMFPNTCTWTIDYWEARYHIPKNTNLTLEQRRTVLCNKIYYRNPMNPARISALISSITGTPVKLIENTDDNTFEVDILTKDADVAAVRKIINETKPSHLTCDLCVSSETNIHVSIGYTPLKIYFRMCGTYPKTGHGLGLSYPNVELEVGDNTVALKFIPSGTIKSGTYPKPYSAMDLDGIQLQPVGSAIPIKVEMASEDVKAGSLPDTAVGLESEGSGAGLSASEKVYATDVTYCGEEDY